MQVIKQLSENGRLPLFVQLLELSLLFDDEDKILRLRCFMKLDILLIQQ